MKTILSLALLFAGCGADGITGDDLGATCPASWLTAASVDASIALPADGGSLLLHAHAEGTQNYQCEAPQADAGAAQGYTWTLIAPAAKLLDCNGTLIGMHSAPLGAASPQWASSDGSLVVGHKVAGFTPDNTAIAWLLLQASSHTGSGIMSRVRYVQRQNTQGGLAAGPCDQGHSGATQDAPYSADYYFFGE